MKSKNVVLIFLILGFWFFISRKNKFTIKIPDTNYELDPINETELNKA